MEQITQEQRNLFNPYKNVSLVFEKRLEDKDNAYISLEKDISFDKESFSEENFDQTIEISLSDLICNPIAHRNDIHPKANLVLQGCKLTLTLFSGQPEWRGRAESPQAISFTKSNNGYKACLHVKAKDSAYLHTFLVAMGQSSTLSIKVDLLCDDSEFAKLEEKKGVDVIVHKLSISFNLPGLDSIIQSLK